MNEFNASSIALTDDILIGALVAIVIISAAWFFQGWFTSYDLQVEKARNIVLNNVLREQQSIMREQQLELSSLRKQPGNAEWAGIQRVTDSVRDW